LTTVVVFAPLGLLSGVVGQFFRALSMTLSVAVLLSLFLSITVVPLLSRWAFRHHTQRPEEKKKRRTQSIASTAGTWTRRRPPADCRRRVDRAGGGHRGAVLRRGTGFLPPRRRRRVRGRLPHPGRQRAVETDQQVRAIEKVISETPDVAAYSRRTGSELGLFATAQNTGDILVRLKPRSERSRSSDEIISDMRPKLQEAAPLAENRVRPAAAGHAGRSRRAADADRRQDFWRRPREARGAAEPVEEMLDKSTAWWMSSACRRAIPRSPGTSTPCERPSWLTVEDVSNQLAAHGSGRWPPSFACRTGSAGSRASA
jgi:multidrug efflux pump subunit AcrB